MTTTTVPPMPLDPADAREISRAAKQAATWTAKRDELIVAALEAGAGPREIGRAAELNHATVIYIGKRARQMVDKHPEGQTAGKDPSNKAEEGKQ